MLSSSPAIILMIVVLNFGSGMLVKSMFFLLGCIPPFWHLTLVSVFCVLRKCVLCAISTRADTFQHSMISGPGACGVICAGLPREGLVLLWLLITLALVKKAPIECRGVGHSVDGSSLYCMHCATSWSPSILMGGVKNGISPLFPGEGSVCWPVFSMPLQKSKQSTPCVLSFHQIHAFNLSVSEPLAAQCFIVLAQVPNWVSKFQILGTLCRPGTALIL